MNLLDLHAPYPAAEIEWRVGSTNGDKTSGLALAYLTARHVMERLDTVCGPENWQDRYEFHGARTVCYLSIRIDGEWVTKADGAGDSDVEAEKGAISDALKRAAVKWGIGRYLYDLGNIWVDLEAAGRSYRIKKNQYAKLQDVLDAQFGPTKMKPEPSSAPQEPVSPPMTYAGHLSAISTAMDEDALRAAVTAANANKTLTPKDKADLRVAKDARKAALLTKPAVAPNFDDLEGQIPFSDLPPATQEAVRNITA
jgi:hypothetical protein